MELKEVDAMRKLKRELWLARAERASDRSRIFYFAWNFKEKLNINGYTSEYKHRYSRMFYSREWEHIWLKVERKCRKKADEYLQENNEKRRATWNELAEWCVKGKGLVLDEIIERVDTGVIFKVDNENNPVDDKIKVRKFGDKDWHEPTVDYMEI